MVVISQARVEIAMLHKFLEPLTELKLGPGVLFITMVGLAPVLAALLAGWLERQHRNRIEKPPQDEKLLRPPGHSLTRRLEDEFGRTLTSLLTSCLCCSLAGLLVVGSGTLAGQVNLWW